MFHNEQKWIKDGIWPRLVQSPTVSTSHSTSPGEIFSPSFFNHLAILPWNSENNPLAYVTSNDVFIRYRKVHASVIVGEREGIPISWCGGRPATCLRQSIKQNFIINNTIHYSPL